MGFQGLTQLLGSKQYKDVTNQTKKVYMTIL